MSGLFGRRMAVYYDADANGNTRRICGSDSCLWMDQRLSIRSMIQRGIDHVKNDRRKPTFMRIEIWLGYDESKERYLTDFIKID